MPVLLGFDGQVRPAALPTTWSVDPRRPNHCVISGQRMIGAAPNLRICLETSPLDAELRRWSPLGWASFLL